MLREDRVEPRRAGDIEGNDMITAVDQCLDALTTQAPMKPLPPVTRMRTIETLLTGFLIDGRALTRRSLIDATIASPRDSPGTQCFPNTGSGKQ